MPRVRGPTRSNRAGNGSRVSDREEVNVPREIEMFDTAMFYSFQLIRRLSVELNFFFFF